MASTSFTVEPRGPFSLAAQRRFVAGWPPADEVAEADDGVLRLCFALDSFEGHAGVAVSQDGDGATVRIHAVGDGHEDQVRAQAARVLSLDHDGTELSTVLEGDPVLLGIHRDVGALRPVLFHSPYEAAAWSVISARIQHSQAVRVRRAISERLGWALDVDGVQMTGFPLPERLAGLDSFEGLPEEKVRRLRGVADAALDGRLDPERLRGIDADEALGELQEIRGIGPFYAGLILVRGVGVVDVLPPGVEPRLRRSVGVSYGLGGPASDEDFARISDRWRPFRTWIAVLMRAAVASD